MRVRTTFAVILVLSIFNFGQMPDPTAVGMVKIKVPVEIDIVSGTDTSTNLPYTFYLRGIDFSKIVPYKGRQFEKDKHGDIESAVDMYEILVPENIYRISVEGFDKFKLANFSVQSGLVINFEIPQYRFAMEELCSGNQRITPLYGYHERISEQQKRFQRSPYRKVATDTVVLRKPYEMVVQHCGKRRYGDIVEFFSARLHYKNNYVAANKVRINLTTLEVEAIGTDEAPAQVQIDAGKIEEKTFIRVIFDTE